MSHGVLDENRRVLIIDDNTDIHADYRRVLNDAHDENHLAAVESALFGDAPSSAAAPALSFELFHAYQGAEGYELVRSELEQGRPFALAFVDMRMPPGWDGLETIKRLWRIEPNLQIVLCTAYSDYSWSEIGEALSPGDRLLILKKPFDAIEVRQLAASLVCKWNLGRAADRSQRDLERKVDERTRELKEAKNAADRASQSKSEFLANISHEIRTPLTAILGFTKLLLDGGDRAEQQAEYLQIIRASAEHQLSLINDLLDVSKIEAGQMQIHRVHCSVPTIVEEVLQTLRFKADEKGLAMASEWPATLSEPVYTDPSRLRQLLINLVNNAIKFTAAGSVRVIVRTTQADGRSKLQIDVIDTGMGISAEKQQVIFDPFVQADSSIAPRFGGTGLGLAISRSIAGLLGGTLTVSSRVQEGSTFTLIIDAERPDTADCETAPSSRGETNAPAVSTSALEGRRVLVVEDNPFNRKLIRLTLTRTGAVVEVAENGQEGVDRIVAADYDLVLMDMQMPVLDGYQATTRIREAGYDGPIIALTAHALPSEREKCLAAGCDAFVGKPIDLDHLKAVVGQFLSVGRVFRRKEQSAVQTQEKLAESDDSPEFREVVREYLASLPEVVAQLRGANTRHDYETVAAVAHTLKGCGGTFGFPELTDIATQAEQFAKDRCGEAISAVVSRLAVYVEQIGEAESRGLANPGG
ncbi:MAG TPA: response regulator [Pirellulales bacterium]|nr:response regulator [Pirellulales bacterium]